MHTKQMRNTTRAVVLLMVAKTYRYISCLTINMHTFIHSLQETTSWLQKIHSVYKVPTDKYTDNVKWLQ